MGFIASLIVQVIITIVASLATAALFGKPDDDSSTGEAGDFQAPTIDRGRLVPVIWGTRLIRDPVVLEMPYIHSYSSSRSGNLYGAGILFGLCHGPVELHDIEYEGSRLSSAAVWDEAAVEDQFAFPYTAASSEGYFCDGAQPALQLRQFGGHVAFDPGGAGGGLADNKGLDGSGEQFGGFYPDGAQYRGIAHAIFSGRADRVHSSFRAARRGFVWGTSPAIGQIGFLVRRTQKLIGGADQWRPDLAEPIAGAMNPIHIVRELFSSPLIGLDYPADALDEATFAAAAQACFDEGIGLNARWDGDDVFAFIEQVLDYANARWRFSRQTNQIQIKAIRADYAEADLLRLTGNQIQAIDITLRNQDTQTENSVEIIYTNPDTYERDRLTLDDDAAIANQQGQVVRRSLPFPFIHDAALAEMIAARELKERISPLSAAVITLRDTLYLGELNIADVFFLDMLMPGDIQLTGAMRIARIEVSEDNADPSIKIHAIQDVFATAPARASYVGTPQAPDATQEQEVEPDPDDGDGDGAGEGGG